MPHQHATASLTLKMVDDKNGNGTPNWGDSISFDVTSSVAYPTVELTAHQDTTLVYRGVVGFWPSDPYHTFILRSGAWTGGAAKCAARLYDDNAPAKTLASLEFDVAA